jgi:hypothetical protein
MATILGSKLLFFEVTRKTKSTVFNGAICANLVDNNTLKFFRGMGAIFQKCPHIFILLLLFSKCQAKLVLKRGKNL